jgi:transcription elongation factor
MFFILIKKSNDTLGKKQKCTICNDEAEMYFNPMKEWKLDGVLCGDCYSKQLADFYPGDHVRLNED